MQVNREMSPILIKVKRSEEEEEETVWSKEAGKSLSLSIFKHLLMLRTKEPMFII